MNTLLATVITGLVTDENKDFYFIQKDGFTFALSKSEGEHHIGEMVKGFAYTDMQQKHVLQLKKHLRLEIIMVGGQLLRYVKTWEYFLILVFQISKWLFLWMFFLN